MIPVLSREQIRELDRHAVEHGVPSLVLMENAGRGAAELIERELERRGERGAVVVVCGPGNNGGDGFVVARRLASRSVAVRVVLTVPGAKLKGDALDNYRAFRGLGHDVIELEDDLEVLSRELRDAGVAIDALFGTGLDRDVTGRMAEVIDRVNAAEALRIALDLPSGIDANSGAVLGAAVRAHLTITFAAHKLGLLTTNGAKHAGRVERVDIGVPESLIDVVGHSAEVVEASDVGRALRRRSVAAHKASAGRVLAVAGSAGKTGAALLVARGALRAGAGLVTIASFPEAADALDQRVLEEMTARIDRSRIEASLDELLANVDAVAIGPGLGLDEPARRVVEHIVLAWDGVKVVDADALTCFAGRAELLRSAAGSAVLTPHPGEAARLLGASPGDVERDRFAALSRLVDRTGATVLLKGPRTLVGAPDELPVVQITDAPALATAGAGDVLTGITAALCCSLAPRSAAIAAAHMHGRSAERWSERTGADRGLLSHEVADELPAVIASLPR
jgi:NAD(P)H-hydrate epimerase